MLMRANGNYIGSYKPEFCGMIDSHAYHAAVVTWPMPLTYVQIDTTNEFKSVHFTDLKTTMDKLAYIDSAKICNMTTSQIGDLLIKLNSSMYNKMNSNNLNFTRDFTELLRTMEDINKLLNGRKRKDLKNKEELRRLDDLEKEKIKLREVIADIYRKDIPSLIIVSTMDMEFAHIGGYEGELIYQEDKENGKIFYKTGERKKDLSDSAALMFQTWKRQLSDTETAVASNPLRLFPLFSYDPRRYRLSGPSKEKKHWKIWNEPFTRIVGHNNSNNDIKKIWLGFCMNPALGFRPFDEFCEHLPKFYYECEKNSIPILAHCVPGGITAHGVEYYTDKTDKRMEKSKQRHEMILREGLSTYQNDMLCSSMYYGEERVILDDKYESLDCFYRHYVHPRNWIPVLEYFPNLRLCLSGFGGNSEWRLVEWSDGDTPLPTRQWIRSIVKLTKYNNVYADLSGLNIYDKKIRSRLLKMLNLIQDDENDDFNHLKHKLIFGSGWHHTYLTETAEGGNSVRHDYSNYCREFKELFYTADKKGKGELWKHVSLFNPWHFYALSQDKIDKINDELKNNATGKGVV